MNPTLQERFEQIANGLRAAGYMPQIIPNPCSEVEYRIRCDNITDRTAWLRLVDHLAGKNGFDLPTRK